HHKFHFANAALPQLYVLTHALALHLAIDQAFHIAQRVYHAEVNVLAIAKRLQQLTQFLTQSLTMGFAFTTDHRQSARLDHGVALPLAPLGLVVVFHGIKIQSESAALPVGTQTHVHAKHKAADGGGIKAANQPLTEFDKKILVAERATRMICVTGFGKGKNQIDIG